MDSQPHRSLAKFKDILKDRHGSSDVLFMSRDWEPVPAYLQTSKISPGNLKQHVLNSERLEYIIRELSEETGQPVKELRKTTEDILDEIGLARSTAVIRWFGIILLKILKRTCTGLYVNEEKLLQIKMQMGKTPVIFAPSHRSYGDFILMSYLCFHYEIQIPAIAAGMDFHSMWLMGHLLRKSCAFFMRRSFNNDSLYWTTFCEYVYKLVTENESSIEFFIEGTRSRSGKSLVPKFGLLSMILLPFFSGRVPDVVIIPVNISYERTLEEKLFAYELLGIPKPKESTKGFLKAMSIMKEKYGKVYMDFGDPISVHEYCGSLLNRSVHSLIPHHVDGILPHETTLCIDLAYSIVRCQQKHAVLMPFNLVAVVLGQTLHNGCGLADLDILVNEVTWIRAIFQYVGATIDLPEGNDDIRDAIIKAIHIHKNLVTVTPAGVVHLTTFKSVQCTRDISKIKGHALLQETMDLSVPLFMLQLYVNPCLHFVVNHALIAFIMRTYGPSKEVEERELFDKYHFLRTLLSYEFVFHGVWEEKDFKTSLNELESLHVIRHHSPSTVVCDNNQKLLYLLCWLIQPFLISYLVMCQVLRQVAVIPLSEINILRASQQRVEEMFLTKSISQPYSLSLETQGCSILSLVSCGALIRHKANGEVKYHAVDSKLADIIQNISVLLSTLHQEKDTVNISKSFAKEILSNGSRSKL